MTVTTGKETVSERSGEHNLFPQRDSNSRPSSLWPTGHTDFAILSPVREEWNNFLCIIYGWIVWEIPRKTSVNLAIVLTPEHPNTNRVFVDAIWVIFGLDIPKVSDTVYCWTSKHFGLDIPKVRDTVYCWTSKHFGLDIPNVSDTVYCW
jgi:hypothetical protein